MVRTAREMPVAGWIGTGFHWGSALLLIERLGRDRAVQADDVECLFASAASPAEPEESCNE